MATQKDRRDGISESFKEASNRKLNLDDILVEEIGQFGRYQIRTLTLTVVVMIFVAWAATEYIFTTARIKTRCLIPECEGQQATEFSPTWLLNAVPSDGGTFDNCLRFEPINETIGDKCPAELFNRNTTVGCTEYVYENTHTVVYDYGLACDEWRRAFIGTGRTIGIFVALPVVGYTSDRCGRRFALSLNAVNTAWVGVLRYWADTYYGFFISEVVEAVIGAGVMSCAYILAIELVGPDYRVAAGAIINTFFSIGQVFMALIAWAVPNWRALTLALFIPQFITISYFWIMSESVRWYLSKGRYKDAENFLKKIARINKRQLSDRSLQMLRENAEADKNIRIASEKETKAKEPWLIVLVFRNKAILTRCCISPVWWFTSALVYYGMSINAVNMSGNRYLNYMAVASAEIPGYWIAVVLMGKIGRRPVLIGAYWICAACQLGYIFLPKNMFAMSLMVYLIGKLAIAVVMMSLYIYTSEIYPTRYRHSLFAFSSMIGRIGSLAAPLTPAFGAALFDDFPSVLFCGFALLSGALVFLAPETLHTELPDTMEEAAAIGDRKIKPQV